MCASCAATGLTGLPDAIGAVWPQAVVRLCVVHYADLRIMPAWRRELLVAAV
jgi:putative transposase